MDKSSEDTFSCSLGLLTITGTKYSSWGCALVCYVLFFFSSFLQETQAALVNRHFIHPQVCSMVLTFLTTCCTSVTAVKLSWDHVKELVTKWASNNHQFKLPDFYLPVDFDLFVGPHVLVNRPHMYPRWCCSAAPELTVAKTTLGVQAAFRYVCPFTSARLCSSPEPLCPCWAPLQTKAPAAEAACAQAGYGECCTTPYNLTTCWINTLLRTLLKRCCLINPAGGIICIFLKSSFSIMQLAFMA